MPRRGKPEDEERGGEEPPRQPWHLSMQPQFLEDLTYWIATDRRTASRLAQLMKEIARDPFTGTGRPEHLRHLPGNTWSRRISEEHRLVYRIIEDTTTVDLLQARYHY